MRDCTQFWISNNRHPPLPSHPPSPTFFQKSVERPTPALILSHNPSPLAPPRLSNLQVVTINNIYFRYCILCISNMNLLTDCIMDIFTAFNTAFQLPHSHPQLTKYLYFIVLTSFCSYQNLFQTKFSTHTLKKVLVLKFTYLELLK